MKKYTLQYLVGGYVVESYTFQDKSKAFAKRWQMSISGRYQVGAFKIVEN